MPKFFVLLLVIVVVTSGFLLFNQTANTPKSLSENDSTPSAKTATTVKTANSRYIPFTQEVFESSFPGTRVLFFYASWCPTCRPADADFAQNADKIPSDIQVIRVNYNDSDTDSFEKDLARKYGVTYQHTFVQIDSAGNQLTIWNGGKLADLITNIK